nr:hypothetical protein Iba_chr02fCG11640 [Ipomoea batatas]
MTPISSPRLTSAAFLRSPTPRLDRSLFLPTATPSSPSAGRSSQVAAPPPPSVGQIEAPHKRRIPPLSHIEAPHLPVDAEDRRDCRHSLTCSYSCNAIL